MKKILFTTFFLLIFHFIGYSQQSLTKMINSIKGKDFEKIYSNRNKITDYQQQAIPLLIALLKDTSFVELDHMPGGFFYDGYPNVLCGRAVKESLPYSLNLICIRASWLLEEITFQDFGYKDLSIYDYDTQSEHLKDSVEIVQLQEQLIKMSDTVTAWWKTNSSTWTRFNALKEALVSNVDFRGRSALRYLLAGRTKCDGLTIDSYNKELKPLVQAIKDKNEENAVYANDLISDDTYYWFGQKTKKK